MADYLNDYPQTVGNGGVNHFVNAQQAKNARLAEMGRSMNASKLWEWARDLQEEVDDPTVVPLPCERKQKLEFIPELEAYVKGLYRSLYPGKISYTLNIILIDLGLEPMEVQQ